LIVTSQRKSKHRLRRGATFKLPPHGPGHGAEKPQIEVVKTLLLPYDRWLRQIRKDVKKGQKGRESGWRFGNLMKGRKVTSAMEAAA